MVLFIGSAQRGISIVNGLLEWYLPELSIDRQLNNLYCWVIYRSIFHDTEQYFIRCIKWREWINDTNFTKIKHSRICYQIKNICRYSMVSKGIRIEWYKNVKIRRRVCYQFFLLSVALYKLGESKSILFIRTANDTNPTARVKYLKKPVVFNAQTTRRPELEVSA